MAHDLKNRVPVYGAFLFFLSFALYLLTVAPTVTFWDSGELGTASYLLGISHQPGYPLFALIGRLFSLIPFGSIAYRLNLVSVAFSALSVLVVYLIIAEITQQIPPSLCPSPAIGGGEKDDTGASKEAGGSKQGPLLSFTPSHIMGGGAGVGVPSGASIAALAALVLAVVRTFWSQAVVTEVYALNSFFISALILLYVKASLKELSPHRYIPLSGLVFGLGVVNHESLILYLPTLILTWLMLPMPSFSKRFIFIAMSLSLMLLGLSVYIYLPVRSLASPGLDIGHPDNIRSFWWTVKWGEYIRAGIPFRPAESLIMGMSPRDPRVFLGVPACVYFSWRLLRRDFRLYMPLLLFALVYGLGISTQVLGGDEGFGLAAKFYIPVFMMLVIFMGVLAHDIIASMGSRYAAPVLAIVFGAMALALTYNNYRPNDYSRNFIAYDYAGNSLNSAGNSGVLFTWGDNGVFPLWYRQQVERFRDDVTLVHTPLMTYDWYLRDVNRWLGADVDYMDPYFLGENVYRILKAVTPGRPVAYDYSTTHFLNMDLSKLKARGLVYFEGPVPPGNPWPTYVFRGVDDPKVFKGPMERNIIAICEYQRKITGGN